MANVQPILRKERLEIMKIILITGGTGFIGKNLIDRLRRENQYKIVCLVQSDDEIGKQYLKKNNISFLSEDDFVSFNGRIDICVHLASYGVAYGARDLNLMIDVNVKLSTRIMKFCVEHGCEFFVNTGSCFEYGSKIQNRLITENDTLCPEDIYAATKVACEDLLKVYSHLLGVKMITIRPFSIFGRYENQSRIGPLVINSGNLNQKLELTGGDQVRDYMDVRDVSDAIVRLLENREKTIDGEAINICSGIPLTLKQFILKIVDAFGFDHKLYQFGVKPYRSNESMFFAGNNKRLFEIIGTQDYSVTDNKIRESYDKCQFPL